MEPAITFYGDQRGTAAIRGGLSSTEVTPLPGSGLPSVSLTVNGITIPALLDTGSPITVINAAAARVAAIQTVESFSDAAANPLTRFAAGMKKARRRRAVMCLPSAARAVRCSSTERRRALLSHSELSNLETTVSLM